jgi:hypothetical protein
VTLAGAHAGEQAAAALVLTAAADGLAAVVDRLAASGLAALPAAEQAGVGLLIFAHHGKPDHGHQHGDRRNDDTIHLKSPPTCSGNKYH